MPLYEYQCESCNNRFEKIQKSYSDPAPEACPKCGKGPVRKLISSPAIQFKGTGWYITDYAKKSATDAGQTGGGTSGNSDKSGSRTALRKPRRPSPNRTRRRSRRRRRPRHLPRATPPRSPRNPQLEIRPTLSKRFDAIEIDGLEVVPEVIAEIGPAQREVDHRLQKSQLVAGVVAGAVDLAAVDRARLQQVAQAVGQAESPPSDR